MGKTFEEIEGILEKLDVPFACKYEWSEGVEKKLPLFDTIYLQFTPEEWCRLCMKEGDLYVGGCCGATSAVQDIISHVFRFESGRMSMWDLARLAQLWIDHDEGPQKPNFKDAGDLDVHIWNWSALDPWAKMAVLWHLTKEYYVPEEPHGQSPQRPEVEKAVYDLARGMVYISHSLMNPDPRNIPPVSQKNASRLMTLYRVLPALKTVWEHVQELNPGPLDGYALLDKERGGGEIASNWHGLCVFETYEEASKLMDQWRTHESASERERNRQEKPIDERMEIGRVRISVEKGLEYLPWKKEEQK